MRLADLLRLAINSGLSSFPVDETKRPIPKWPGSRQRISWNPFRQRFATQSEIQNWNRRTDAAAAGIVCGHQSEGLEIIDFDLDAESIFPMWLEKTAEGLRVHAAARDNLCRILPVNRTPSGGFHVYYRSNEPEGNLKLAMRPDSDGESRVAIETRGEGGYAVTVGGRLDYTRFSGQSLKSVPRISLLEREILLDAARWFNAVPQRASRAKQQRPVQRFGAESISPFQSETPWDAFNRSADLAEVLHHSDWTSADGIHWRRPGKTDEGHSAVIRQAADGNEVLCVFSTNSGRLCPDAGETHKTLSKFQVLKELQFRGDGAAAARFLISKGFGR